MSSWERRRARDRERDRDRGAGQELGGVQDRRRDLGMDSAEVKRRAERLRTMEAAHPQWSHTCAEHIDATDADLQRRAATGVNARGHSEAFIPENATRWQSEAACVTAADRLWRTPHAQQQRAEIEREAQAGRPVKQSFTERQTLSQALGPGWRDDVYGRSRASHGFQPSQWHDNSHVVAVYRRQSDGNWHLYTCYPNPDPLPGP